MSKKPTLIAYSVTVYAWSAHTTVVKARNHDAAVEQAESLWCDDDSVFRYLDGGINAVSAEQVSS
jgi:hypothetical protein